MKKNYLPRFILTQPISFIACGFGAGAMRFAPGTWGTLMAVPFYLLLRHLSAPLYMLVLVFSTIFGIWICEKTTQALKVHDHPGIVWDEMVGFWLTMFLVPMRFNFYWILLGFVLFRLFDIWKPWPIRWLDRHVKGGVGIMFDDILAAIYAWVILQVIIFGALR